MVAFTNKTGKLDADQIRGWMTLADISAGYGIPLERLYAQGKLPSQVDPASRLNQIASNYHLKFEPDSMREVVGSYLGGQAESGKKQDHPKGSEEVRGTMSLNEISSRTGVPKDYILKTLKLPASVNANIPAREWLHAHDKSMQDIREAVTRYRAEQKKK